MHFSRLTSLAVRSPVTQLIPATIVLGVSSRVNIATVPLAHSIFRNSSFSRALPNLNQGRFFSSLKPSKEGFTMSKVGKIGLLLMGGVLLTTVGLYASEKGFVQKKERTESNLLSLMHSKVLDTIKCSENIPGLKLEEFSALRNEISKTWNILIEHGVLEVSGTDRDIRPYFVALQGVIEHVLATELQKEVTTLKGVIHTPMPATPLCTTGDISKDLVDPSIESDSSRLFTVKARTTIIRDYLFKGGDLYVVYPKNGLKQRTEEQQKIYQNALVNFPSHLFDVPLNCEDISTDLIGATYLFQDQSGRTFVFAIKMTQAKDPKDIGNFGLWFGPINHPSIQERIRAVSNYLEQNGSNVLKIAIKE